MKALFLSAVLLVAMTSAYAAGPQLVKCGEFKNLPFLPSGVETFYLKQVAGQSCFTDNTEKCDYVLSFKDVNSSQKIEKLVHATGLNQYGGYLYLPESELGYEIYLTGYYGDAMSMVNGKDRVGVCRNVATEE